MFSKRPVQQEDGSWVYAITWDDGVTEPIGYCAGWHWDEEERTVFLPVKEVVRARDRVFPHKKKFHSCGHKSEKNARQCYKKYLLDVTIEYDVVTRERSECEIPGCVAWSGEKAVLGAGEYSFFLCRKHMRRKYVAQLLDVGDTKSEPSAVT